MKNVDDTLQLKEKLISLARKGYEKKLIIIPVGHTIKDNKPKCKRLLWQGKASEQQWNIETFTEKVNQEQYVCSVALRTGLQNNKLYLNCLDFDIDFIVTNLEKKQALDVFLHELRQNIDTKFHETIEITKSNRIHFWFYTTEPLQDLNWKVEGTEKENGAVGEIQLFAQENHGVTLHRGILTYPDSNTIIEALTEEHVLSIKDAKILIEYLGGYDKNEAVTDNIYDIEVDTSEDTMKKVIDFVKDLIKKKKEGKNTIDGWSIDSGLSWYLVKLDLSDEKIHNIFHYLWQNEYSQSITQNLINNTRRKVNIIGPNKAFIDVLKSEKIYLFEISKVYPYNLEKIDTQSVILFTDEFTRQYPIKLEEDIKFNHTGLDATVTQLPLHTLQKKKHLYKNKEVLLIAKTNEIADDYIKFLNNSVFVKKLLVKILNKELEHITYNNIEKFETAETITIKPTITFFGEEYEYDIHKNTYIVESLLKENSLTIIDGIGSTGKSYLIMQLGMCISTGNKFLDFLNIYKPSNVVYIAAEDDPHELSKRAVQLRAGLGYDYDFKFAKHNFYMYSMEDKQFLDMFEVPYLFTRQGGTPVKTKMFDFLSALVERHEAKVLILDSLAHFFGLNENSSEDASLFMNTLRHMAAQHEISILIIHHQNKSALHVGDKVDSIRGSSAFRDLARIRAYVSSVSNLSQEYAGYIKNYLKNTLENSPFVEDNVTIQSKISFLSTEYKMLVLEKLNYSRYKDTVLRYNGNPAILMQHKDMTLVDIERELTNKNYDDKAVKRLLAQKEVIYKYSKENNEVHGVGFFRDYPLENYINQQKATEIAFEEDNMESNKKKKTKYKSI